MASCTPGTTEQHASPTASNTNDATSSALAASELASSTSATSSAATPSVSAAATSSLASEHVRTIVCLGDSITYGYGLAFPSRDSWPGLLGARLGGGWDVVNLGVSATTLLNEGSFPYRSTGNVEHAKKLNADLVFIMLGTNDAHSTSWNPERHREQLRALVQEMKGASGTTEIVLLVPPRAFYDAAVQEYYPVDVIGVDMRAIISEVAEAEGAQVVDLYAFTENHPEWFPDALHPNDEGHRALADYIYQNVFAR